MRKARFGLIGCGMMGRRHTNVFRDLGKASIFEYVAVCDRSEERANTISEALHVPHYADLEDMLRKEELDVIDICTPHFTHHTLAKTAAENGKSVIVEKPIAITLPCADFMIKACERANVHLEVAENWYRMPQERLITKIIREGMIGKVLVIHDPSRWPPPPPFPQWLSIPELAGGGPLIYAGIHSMSLLRTYMGCDAQRVVGMTKSFMQPELAVENWGHAIMDFENDAVAIFDSGVRGVENTQFDRIIGEKGAITKAERISRSGGKLGLTLFQNVKAVEVEIERETRRIGNVEVLQRYLAKTNPETVWENPFKNILFTPNEEEWHIGFADELTGIANAVLHDKKLEYGAIQGRKDLELIEAIYESSLRGMKPIRIPIASTTLYEQKIHEAYEKRFGHDILDIC